MIICWVLHNLVLLHIFIVSVAVKSVHIARQSTNNDILPRRTKLTFLQRIPQLDVPLASSQFITFVKSQPISIVLMQERVPASVFNSIRVRLPFLFVRILYGNDSEVDEISLQYRRRSLN